MADELIKVGGLSNSKRLKETTTTQVVAELVFTQPMTSTEILGYVKIDQTTPGVSNAIAVTSSSGGIVGIDNARTVPVSLYGKATVAADTAIAADPQGNLWVAVGIQGLQQNVGNVATDGNLPGNYPMLVQPISKLYNGASWDRQRNNVAATLLASAARTATANSPDQINYNGSGVRVHVQVSASTGASITANVQIADSVSGAYVTVLTSTAITSTGDFSLRVYPGITAVANQAVSDVLARTWRVSITHASTSSVTYSVGADTLL